MLVYTVCFVNSPSPTADSLDTGRQPPLRRGPPPRRSTPGERAWPEAGRPRGRARRRARRRFPVRFLQRIAPPFVVGRPDARRRLPVRLGRYCANRPGTTRAGLLTTTAPHASTMPLTSSRAVGRFRSPRTSNQSEYTLFPSSDCPRNQDHVRWARPGPNNLHALIQGA